MDNVKKAAGMARERACAPDSGFRVECALEAKGGDVFAGRNAEDPSHGEVDRAGRAAVGHRRSRRPVLVTEAPGLAIRRDACRQVLAEFARKLELVASGSRGGEARGALGTLWPRTCRPPAAAPVAQPEASR